jgi:hypothetical protein
VQVRRRQHVCRRAVRQFVEEPQTLTRKAFIARVFGLSERLVSVTLLLHTRGRSRYDTDTKDHRPYRNKR